MITVRLEAPLGRWHKTLAPAQEFRAVGASLQCGAANQEIALYRAGRWHRTSATGTLWVLTGPFAALRIDSTVLVKFSDPATGKCQAVGEVRGLRIEKDELKSCDDEVLARFDEAHDAWLDARDNQSWPVLVLATPVAAGGASGVTSRIAESLTSSAL